MTEQERQREGTAAFLSRSCKTSPWGPSRDQLPKEQRLWPLIQAAGGAGAGKRRPVAFYGKKHTGQWKVPLCGWGCPSLWVWPVN
jgi:hypothetical protein